MEDGPGAHDAGLQGHVQGRARQAVVADATRGRAQGHDLRVRARIAPGDGAVPTLAQHLTLADQHRPDRHLARLSRALGEQEGLAHPAGVILIPVGRHPPVGAPKAASSRHHLGFTAGVHAEANRRAASKAIVWSM